MQHTTGPSGEWGYGARCLCWARAPSGSATQQRVVPTDRHSRKQPLAPRSPIPQHHEQQRAHSGSCVATSTLIHSPSPPPKRRRGQRLKDRPQAPSLCLLAGDASVMQPQGLDSSWHRSRGSVTANSVCRGRPFGINHPVSFVLMIRPGTSALGHVRSGPSCFGLRRATVPRVLVRPDRLPGRGCRAWHSTHNVHVPSTSWYRQGNESTRMVHFAFQAWSHEHLKGDTA